MTFRSMELFRRGRLLLLSGALVIGGLAAAAAPAHAVAPQLKVAPANSAICPVLTFSGSSYPKNTPVQVHIYRDDSYVTTFNVWSDANGSFSQTYPNHFTGKNSFSAYSNDPTREEAWSNQTAYCVN